MTGATKNEEAKRPVNPRKKMIKMASIDKDMVCSTTYRMSIEEPLPELPDCAVRVKVGSTTAESDSLNPTAKHDSITRQLNLQISTSAEPDS